MATALKNIHWYINYAYQWHKNLFYSTDNPIDNPIDQTLFRENLRFELRNYKLSVLLRKEWSRSMLFDIIILLFIPLGT